jgi:hypothetical protein
MRQFQAYNQLPAGRPRISTSTRSPDPRLPLHTSDARSAIQAELRAQTREAAEPGEASLEEMAQSLFTRCTRQALKQSRSIHAHSASNKSSIAHILDKGPENAEKVVVNGFIRSIRNQKQRSFASIGDGSTLEPLQALLTPEQAQRSETYLPIPHAVPMSS